MMSMTSDDVMRVFARCRLDACRALGEETVVDDVTLIVNRDLAGVADANVAFVARTPDAGTIDRVNQRFAESASRCAQWIIYDAGKSDITAPPPYQSERRAILRLAAWPGEISPREDLQIIPARAALAKTEQLMHVLYRNDATAVAAAMQHLDEPRFELLIGLSNSTPVACAGLLTSGDAGLITGVATHPDHRRRGYARAVVNRAIESASRGTLRHVLAETREDDAPALALAESLGFHVAGAFVAWTIGSDTGSASVSPR
jgi:ribosomal protein S18 acetylase RimI-like enzyme